MNKREFVIMKKSILIGLLSVVLINGCGRPENYTEKARIDFSAAYSTLMATYNQGVLIAAVKNTDTNRVRRFWLNPNVSESGEFNALFEPGRWDFYAVGFSGSSFTDGSLTYKCGYQGPVEITPGLNTISKTLGTCASGSNDRYSNSEKISLANICKTNFNSNFHCGP